MFLLTAPFAGALTKYLGVQPVVIAGTLLSFTGLLIASFAKEFYVLFLTIPFMTGNIDVNLKRQYCRTGHEIRVLVLD